MYKGNYKQHVDQLGVYGPETWPVNPIFPLSEWTQHMAAFL